LKIQSTLAFLFVAHEGPGTNMKFGTRTPCPDDLCFRFF
jgi:hypothetical protein